VAELDARKREIFSWYAEDLQAEPGITLNQTGPGVKNAYWMVTAIFDPGLGLLKEEVISRLGADGIDTRPFFYPHSSQPAYASQPSAAEARRRNRVAYRVSPYGVNLPSALSLTRDQVRFVCTKLHNLLERRAAA
jgi:perosamine synthetase